MKPRILPTSADRLADRTDSVLWEGRVGLLCNQTSFLWTRGRYLFQELASRGVLRRVFVPEHGLFAELQDQIALDDGSVYRDLAASVEFESLYGSKEETLSTRAEKLRDLDLLLIDIQDVGSRYYTFATTAGYLFDLIRSERLTLKVIVLDHPNPAGRFVEGTPLPLEYRSFVGREKILHRHGLTTGELLSWIHSDTECKFPLEVERIPDWERTNGFDATDEPWQINPSPNMCSPFTPLVYSGQCLLEGTNLSEGRGTTRPFEIFGAPYLAGMDFAKAPSAPGAMLRPLRFLPTFHKHANTICHGFQIHTNGPYHSLAHTMRILRWIWESTPAFEWKRGVYEFRSDRPAIELLAGDPVLLGYLRGERRWEEAEDFLKHAEEAWIRSITPSLLYPGALLQAPVV